MRRLSDLSGLIHFQGSTDYCSCFHYELFLKFLAHRAHALCVSAQSLFYEFLGCVCGRTLFLILLPFALFVVGLELTMLLVMVLVLLLALVVAVALNLFGLLLSALHGIIADPVLFDVIIANSILTQK